MVQTANSDVMTCFLYLYDQRILAQNIDGRLINLGSVDQREDGWHWELDGNHIQGAAQDSTEALLDAIAQHLDFPFLDGLFTSLPDVSSIYLQSLDEAPRKVFSLPGMNGSHSDYPDSQSV